MEAEADTFAAELLMPEPEYRRAIGRHNRGLPGIKRLAEEFATSLTATAIRYALQSPDPVAVIVSRLSAEIDYAFASDALRAVGASYIPKGTLVPRASRTFEVLRRIRDLEEVLREEGASFLSAWFDNPRNDFELDEDVMPLGRTGQILTVLSADWIPAVDEEESE